MSVVQKILAGLSKLGTTGNPDQDALLAQGRQQAAQAIGGPVDEAVAEINAKISELESRISSIPSGGGNPNNPNTPPAPVCKKYKIQNTFSSGESSASTDIVFTYVSCDSKAETKTARVFAGRTAEVCSRFVPIITANTDKAIIEDLGTGGCPVIPIPSTGTTPGETTTPSTTPIPTQAPTTNQPTTPKKKVKITFGVLPFNLGVGELIDFVNARPFSSANGVVTNFPRSASIEVEEGSSVRLLALPVYPKFKLLGWFVDGKAITPSAEFNYTATDKDVTIVARYRES